MGCIGYLYENKEMVKLKFVIALSGGLDYADWIFVREARLSKN